MNIEDLGYTPFFETEKNRLGFGEFSVARVTSESKGAYKVKNTDGEFLGRITGKQIFEASSREDYPAVGDWVVITKADEKNVVIEGTLPRLTIMKRTHGDKNRAGEKDKTQIIATNIDIAFVIESVDRDYNLNRFERYFTIAKNGGVKPVIILNKIDLLSPEDFKTQSSQIKNRFPDIDVIFTSTKNNEGLHDLKAYIEKGKTYCFLGSSGVGKSSLINKLIGEDTIKTGDISSQSGMGRHVTTSRQMYFLENGGIVIDNPGVREVGMADVSEGVNNFFDEVTALAKTCKYSDCTHVHEPGCAVREAVELGTLDEEKYQNYTTLKKEAEYFEMNNVQKRTKNKEFGKFKQTAKKDLKTFGRKN